ncbi:1-acyl-sn-glycerol-3-phosphate acyltransferase alpha-like [Amphiura filiformis]|uniref:1-acyl-sn-glycerol-3-phosphate acyltransferase alpha-like n=1 Tax=Amphiura filiformis TaxID=82378 RepID=UPI003B2156DE
MVGENIQIALAHLVAADSHYKGLGLVCMAVFMALLLAANVSKAVRFYIKYFAYNGMYLVLGVVCIPFMLMSPGDPDNMRWASRFTSMSVKYIFGVRVSTTGLEHLNSNEPYIAVCNHQSTIDHIGMMEIWPQRCTLMVKQSLKYAGPFGIAAILCGCIFVDRSNKARAKEAMAETIQTIKRKHAKIWMFPEGTRSLSHDTKEPMLPFKKGAFHLAVEAQVPIVPLVFSSQEKFFSFREHRFTSGNYAIKVLPPVSTEGLTSDDVPKLTAQIRENMMDTYVALTHQATHNDLPAT